MNPSIHRTRNGCFVLSALFLLSMVQPLWAGTAETGGDATESWVKGSGPLTFHAGGAEKMRINHTGEVWISATTLGVALAVGGDTRFGCRSGFWNLGDGRLCMDTTMRGPTDMHTAIGVCKALAPGCRVCTHGDFQRACGAGQAPFGVAPGWYGDHGLTTSGDWDDEYGTWNMTACADNNDGGAFIYSSSYYYRCCY